MRRRFSQVDVFTGSRGFGNPLAVVAEGDGLSDAELQEFASWTNLSETTFLLPPTGPDADYRVRIFTPTTELPFAGHPTLGSCAVWLTLGGDPHVAGEVVQECGLGLVRIRHRPDGLSFAAPPLVRSGPVDGELRARIESVLGADVVDAAWADNGPGWVAAELADAEAVLAVRPDFGDQPVFDLGIVGRAPPGSDHHVEVRAFFPGPSGPIEDPVTGSLNASLAMWLMARDPSLERYVARQGTVLGRDGRVVVERDTDGTIWVGGRVTEMVTGTVDLPR
jgi:PhzF family phenazine biosynthesis protein